MNLFVTKLRKLQIRLRVVDGQLKINAPAGVMSAEILNEIKENKEQLIKYITGISGEEIFQGIERAPLAEYYSLSSAQKRLYFLYAFNNTSLAYNMPRVLQLEGELDREQLLLAFNRLITRHESLRTSFEMIGGEPVQIVHGSVIFEIPLSRDHAENPEVAIQQFITPFDLGRPPLIRAQLLEITPGKHLLMIDMHHIITDGMSQDILIRDFMLLYKNETLLPLPLQYKDYAVWQQHNRQQERMSAQKDFWCNIFSHMPPALELPTDFIRPAIENYKGNSLSFTIKEEAAEQLKRLTEAAGATMFMGLLSIFNILLARLGNQQDIVIGVPVAGRQHADLEGMIGMFVNMIPLRNYPSPDLSFEDFLSSVRSNTLACFANQDYQYELLIGDLRVERNAGRNPLLNVLFAYGNFEQTRLELPGLALNHYHTGHQVSMFDLTLSASHAGGEIILKFEYATDIFKEKTIERFGAYFLNIVSAVVADPKIKLRNIEILPHAEKHQLLHALNKTSVGYPEDKTINGLFAEQVKRTPDNIALKFGDEVLTYSELDLRSSQLALSLRNNGVKNDTIVALLMDRSINTIVGMLGIIRAGGAYLPIDIDYPRERTDYLIKDSDAHIILTSRNMKEKPALVGKVLFIEDSTIPGPGSSGILDVNSPSDLCYVIYTSGTTGNPKGVMIEHKNLVRLFFNDNPLFDFGPDDVWTMFHSHCFDFSVWEIFGALLFGGKLIIIPKMTARDTKAYFDILKTERATILNQTPSAFYNLISEALLSTDASLCLRYVIFGGEALTPGKLRSWKAKYPQTKLINMFGITETTVHVTYKEIGDHEIAGNISNVGIPIPTLSVYVLDQQQQLVPAGVTGELCVGGAGVSRGYLGNETLTRAKFITNPYDPSEKLYRSGDLSRILDNGDIEYLGRMDQQVKIRGFRIELGEIENQLAAYSGIKECVVTDRGEEEDRYLAAYYVAEEEIAPGMLRDFLTARLPDYMVPANYTRLSSLPLTYNGKLDKKSLPAPMAGIVQFHMPPVGETAEKLAAVWSEVLKIDKAMITAGANFFELGGHSVKAMHVINAIALAFYVKIDLRKIFENPTLEKMSTLIRQLKTREEITIAKVKLQEYYKTSPAQERLFYSQLLNNDNTINNVSVALEMKWPVDIGKLTAAFRQLINRHEGLRTSFMLGEDGVLQKINSDVPFELEILDPNRYENTGAAFEDFDKPFNLSAPTLLRGGLLKQDGARCLLFISIHHIVCDGIALNILVKDFHAICQGRELPLPDLRYIDYVYWIMQPESHIQAQKKFWEVQLSGELPRLNLPVMRSREGIYNHPASIMILRINGETYQHIRRFVVEQGVSDFMLLLSVFYILLSKMSGSSDIIIGTDATGRTWTGLDGIVGTFVNILPLRLRHCSEGKYAGFLQEVKRFVLDAYDNQEFQFNQMIELLDKRERASLVPIFDVHFSFSNALDADKELHELSLIPLKRDKPVTSRYEFQLEVEKTDDAFNISFVYSNILYNRETISYFMEYYHSILQTVLKDETIDIESIELESSFRATTGTASN